MVTVRWLAGTLLIGFSLVVCVCNIALVCKWFLRHEHSSLVLVVGGLAAMAGFLIVPVEEMNRWFWIPLIADLAIPYLVGLGFSIAKKGFHS